MEEERPNGKSETGASMDESSEKLRFIEIESVKEEETLYRVLHHIMGQIIFPDPKSQAPLFRRIKRTLVENGPSLKEGTVNSYQKLLFWTKKGGPWRGLLVISVGAIALLALTGLLTFMLFLSVATANAVIISLFVSFAAAGGFLAIFFACVTAIYIAVLSIAAFVISTVTLVTIFAVFVATGWVGFLWIIWLATKKSIDITKHSIAMTGSAVSSYSAARRAHHTH
ncbi:hypothetical protein AMTRI_Chr04g244210 [Amborella trichopoda]